MCVLIFAEQRDNFTLSGLAQLDDYYSCRLAAYSDVIAPQRSTLCAHNLVEDARSQYADIVEYVRDFIAETRDLFQICESLPEDDQATCFINWYTQVEVEVGRVTKHLRENIAEIRNVFEVLLNQYYLCRSK